MSDLPKLRKSWASLTQDEKHALIRPYVEAEIPPSIIVWKMGGDARKSDVAAIVREIEQTTELMPGPRLQGADDGRPSVPSSDDAGAKMEAQSPVLPGREGDDTPPSSPAHTTGQSGRSVTTYYPSSQPTSSQVETVDETAAPPPASVPSKAEAATPPPVAASANIAWDYMSAQAKGERVKQLYMQGLSGTEIANRLGATSRSAVLGVINRLRKAGKLPPADPGRVAASKGECYRAPKSVRQPSERLQKPGTVKSVAVSLPAYRGGRVVYDEASPAPSIPENLKLPLVELSDSTCRWPGGDPRNDDFSFCGAATGGSPPYCAYHSRLAFVPRSEHRKAR